ASGRTCRATAALFGVSVASVVKWSQRWRVSGSAAAKPMGGCKQLRLKSEREWLLARITEKPGLTLRAVVAELAERDTLASYGAVWRFFKRKGISFKKSLYASEQDRADIARRRAQWKKYQGRLDPKRLVFIDETWAKTNMTRRHGRSPRGTRLIAKLPHGRWRTLTFLAALRCDRIAAPCVIDGPINGASFRAYVEQFLVPTLSAGDIVIMDNLGSHKGQAVLPAALLARSQPDRAGLCQAQDPIAQNRSAHHRGHLARHRHAPRPLQTRGMRQLPPQRRLCFSL